VSAKAELRMLEGSEFQTVGAAMNRGRQRLCGHVEPTKNCC